MIHRSIDVKKEKPDIKYLLNLIFEITFKNNDKNKINYRYLYSFLLKVYFLFCKKKSCIKKKMTSLNFYLFLNHIYNIYFV